MEQSRGKAWCRYRADVQQVRFGVLWKSFFLKNWQFLTLCVEWRLWWETWRVVRSWDRWEQTWYRDRWRSKQWDVIVRRWVFVEGVGVWGWFFVLFVRCFNRGCWWWEGSGYFGTCFWFGWSEWCQRIRRLTVWCWRWRWLGISWLRMMIK